MVRRAFRFIHNSGIDHGRRLFVGSSEQLVDRSATPAWGVHLTNPASVAGHLAHLIQINDFLQNQQGPATARGG